MILALIGISMPVFWLGEVVNLITQDRLHDTFFFSWVPPLGYTPFTQDPWQWFLHLIIPWITLSILYIGFYARVLRANMLEVAERGLRPHCQGQGPLAAAASSSGTCCAPR